MGLYLCIFDDDGDDVEGFDVGHYSDFEACVTGPGSLTDPTCACSDDDADGDVDLLDFARFQRTFVGP